MKIKLKYIVFCTAMVTAIINGQDKKEKKAGDKFENYAYSNAIVSYEDLLKKGYTSEEIYKNLGNSNYYNANYEEASKWYEKLFQLENTTVDAEYMYKYAQTLKSLKEYDKSDAWMQKFEALKSGDLRAQKFTNTKDYLLKIKENSGRYDIKNIPINSTASDFAPSFNGEELIFSTARDTGIVTRNIHEWNNKPFLNLYGVTVSENDTYGNPSKLSKMLNHKTHESSTAFTKDGSTLYFTRNNSENRNFSRDKKGISRLKIYRATLINDIWSNITELPFNSDDYSVAHPTLSSDESKLYFASNMPGTLGASDIFVVDINTDGGFGTPKNLGPKINTESRETFPFITASNKLYFASDGHPGLGGLDVFGTSLENMHYVKIQNVGMPVNSEEDDFSYIVNESTNKGYFASNRSGGMGSDDIYSFIENTPLDFRCTTTITGVIKDKKTNEIIPNANVTVMDNEGNLLSKTIADSNGTFSLEGDCKEGNYKVIASMTDYEDGNVMIAIVNAQDTSDVEVLLASTLEEVDLGTDLAKSLQLEPIYFDFDRSYIRSDAKVVLEKVVAYLRQYPEAKVEVRSHTDARANDNYNLRLSEKRAQSTVKHLISQGIDSSRITGKGYGETQLTNNCDNAANCTKEEHQLNRRSEFIIVQ